MRRAPALSLPVVGGRLRLPSPAADAPPPAAAAPSGALLLGVMSGSAVRRARPAVRMQSEILRPQVRALFVVGKAAAEAMPDVLPVDVQARGAQFGAQFFGAQFSDGAPSSRALQEGQFMRSHSQNKSTSYDASTEEARAHRHAHDLLEARRLPALRCRAAEPMIGRSDDDVLISPWMLIAHTQWLVARATYSLYLYAGAFSGTRGGRRR